MIPTESTETLGLSVRSYEVLRLAGIVTVDQLRHLTERDLSRLHKRQSQSARKFIAEIREEVLRLNDSPPSTSNKWRAIFRGGGCE